MKLTIFGTGYVGLVTGACFAEMGNTVLCADIDGEKVDKLRKNIIPIYEPGLEEIVRRNTENGNLDFTADIKKAVEFSGLVFIAVGTPMSETGAADMRYVDGVAEQISKYAVRDMVVVDKSTVPPRTAKRLQALFNSNAAHKFDVVSNPEFLKEGTAVNDCMSPDRVVIGAFHNETAELLKSLYAPFVSNHDRFVIMDPTSAEITKYASNAMLATRISFMNELSAVCEATGADITKVRLGMGSDSRIGYSFLYAGTGYGGSCFPKDVQALIYTAAEHKKELSILRAVEAVNKKQKRTLVDKVTRKFGDDLSGKKFAVWGLSFKPNTDDIREAPSIVIAEELVELGAEIVAYDPIVKDFPVKVSHTKRKYAALEDVDALLLITEWKEFRTPDFDEMKSLMKSPVIFDGRNQYDGKRLTADGWDYYGIGV